MRKLMIPLVLFMVATASPAVAGGFRAEVHGGWDRIKNDILGSRESGVSYGVSLGYDFDITENFFMGIEGGVDDSTTKECFLDTCLKAGLDVGGVVRIGYQIQEAKLYAIGGYSHAKLTLVDDVDSISEWGDGWRVGAGYELNFESGVYTKVEYRYTNYSAGFERHLVMVGVGYQF
jgi:outer membrane immunogenic protein